MVWKRSLDDLRRVSGLFIQHEMVKAMSVTESFLFTAGKIFGEAEPEVTDLTSFSQMQAYVREINGG